MELGLVLVVLAAINALEAGYLIPGSLLKSTKTHGRREEPVVCLSGCNSTALKDVAYVHNREFSWKALVRTEICSKSLTNGGLGEMAVWKLRQSNKFDNDDLEFEVLSSGAPISHTLFLATGISGTALFILIALFVCFRMLSCGRRIKAYECELCGCLSNGKRRYYRKTRTPKDSSTSSAAVQMVSLSSPVQIERSASLVASDLETNSASPNLGCPIHFSFNDEDLRVGLMESLNKVDEVERVSQGFVIDENKNNNEGPTISSSVKELPSEASSANPPQEQEQEEEQNQQHEGHYRHHNEGPHQDELHTRNQILPQPQPLPAMHPPQVERQQQQQQQDERQSERQIQEHQQPTQLQQAPAPAPEPAPAPAPAPTAAADIEGFPPLSAPSEDEDENEEFPYTSHLVESTC